MERSHQCGFITINILIIDGAFLEILMKNISNVFSFFSKRAHLIIFVFSLFLYIDWDIQAGVGLRSGNFFVCYCRFQWTVGTWTRILTTATQCVTIELQQFYPVLWLYILPQHHWQHNNYKSNKKECEIFWPFVTDILRYFHIFGWNRSDES